MEIALKIYQVFAEIFKVLFNFLFKLLRYVSSILSKFFSIPYVKIAYKDAVLVGLKIVIATYSLILGEVSREIISFGIAFALGGFLLWFLIYLVRRY